VGKKLLEVKKGSERRSVVVVEYELKRRVLSRVRERAKAHRKNRLKRRVEASGPRVEQRGLPKAPLNGEDLSVKVRTLETEPILLVLSETNSKFNV